MNTNQINGTSRKPPFRPLQPRSAAAIDFNESDDEEGPLSADYRQQRNTTKDLVDFFKNTPPPPPLAPTLPPLAPEEKKKKGILHRLRSRKTNLSLSRDGPARVNSVAPSTQGSSVSASSRGEVATLPNGKKYIMIAVDYKNSTGELLSSGMNGVSRTPLILTPNKRLSMIKPIESSGSKRNSILSNNPNFQMTTTIQEDSNVAGNSSNDSSKRSSQSTDKRRSIIIHAGGGEGSSFTLEDTPFLLDNFALDTEFINTPAGTEQNQVQQPSNGILSPGANEGESNGARILKPSQLSQGNNESSSKRTTRVTFNIAGQQNEPMTEEAVSNALAERIANHKAQLSNGTLPQAFNSDSNLPETKAPEVVLPKPITRKKVRHVQIQTQHCIMRPMHTQTEPLDSLISDSEPKEFSCQTEDSIDDSTDIGTCTDSETTTVTSTKVGRTSSKVASYVASFNQPAVSAATLKSPATVSKGISTAEFGSTTTSTTMTSREHEELVQLRQQNKALQAQVASLQRELSAETRARTRAIVAMQDTRDKFEALSSMAYKKMKEMITNRHILEMEVRELRAQTDMQNDDGEIYGQSHMGYVI